MVLISQSSATQDAQDVLTPLKLMQCHELLLT